ncbi:hypothetical protein sr10939 [Sporisorium reilianum SRZ2]|uniref:Uncharacterized protein n=1 Tax=Sporisorium reilianum (strain SRZ2) TaxID=999809 RepID=E6ZVH6_SPORE|nr:hypothetical protein sr10939 [Sporisorium reilianum SRZ2]
MVVIHPPRFLGASSRLPGTYDITDTGFYVALSLVVSSYAGRALVRHGIKGYAGTWRAGAVAAAALDGDVSSAF